MRATIASGSMRLYRYVGPEEIRLARAGQPGGDAVERRSDLSDWVASSDEADGSGAWATYVIDPRGRLLVAHRRSEHVACAGGEEVRGAGELHATPDGSIDEISNLSTGYCPELESWESVSAALDRAGLPHPDGFTFSVEFRRCDRCGERNVIKDDHFYCAICDAPLPRRWNFQ